MHGLRVEAVEAQAEAMDVPLKVVEVPDDDVSYRERMEEAMSNLRARGFTDVVFGDVHLEDVRCYREEHLGEVEGRWPIWGRDTGELAMRAAEELSAVVVCAPERLNHLVGEEYDVGFVESLPEDVDPLGENGEFHTYVHDAPFFAEPVAHELGERVEKTLADDSTYHYVDVRV